MHAVAREGVEEDGEGGYERFTLTCGHFGNFALMEHDAAEELHVVVHHVPLHVVAAGNPVVLVGGGELAVEVGGGDGDFGVFGEAAGCVLDNGEDVGEHLGEGFVHAVEHLRFEFVNLVEDNFAVFEGCVFDFRLEFLDFRSQFGGRCLHLLAEFEGAGTEGVVVEVVNGGVGGFDFFNPGLNELHVAGRLVAEEFAEKFVDVHICAWAGLLPRGGAGAAWIFLR